MKRKSENDEDEAEAVPAKRSAVSNISKLSKKRSFDSCLSHRAAKNELKKITLSTDISKVYTVHRSAVMHVQRRKEYIRRTIFFGLSKHFETNVFIVGSSANGFAHHSSGLDINVVSKGGRSERMTTMVILRRLKTIFDQKDFAINLSLVTAEQHEPYLTFTDHCSDLDVFVYVNRNNTLRSTKLLKSYSKLDKRVAPLIVVVKCWGQNGFNFERPLLSGYSLSLMAIHFLQSGCRPAVLPSLQKTAPREFNGIELPINVHAGNLEFRSENVNSFGELLHELFQFYTHRFNFNKDVISIREGRAIPKSSVMFLEGNDDRVFVEDPFDGKNTVSVENERCIQEIHSAFRTSLARLTLTGDLHSIL